MTFFVNQAWLSAAALRCDDLRDDAVFGFGHVDYFTCPAGATGLGAFVLDSFPRVQGQVRESFVATYQLFDTFAANFTMTHRLYSRAEEENTEATKRIWKEFPGPGIPRLPRPPTTTEANHPKPTPEIEIPLGSELASRHLGEPGVLEGYDVMVQAVDAVVMDAASTSATFYWASWALQHLTGIDLGKVLTDFATAITGDWRPVFQAASQMAMYSLYFGDDALHLGQILKSSKPEWDGDGASEMMRSIAVAEVALGTAAAGIGAVSATYLQAATSLILLRTTIANLVSDLIATVASYDQSIYEYVRTDPPPVVIGKIAGAAIGIAAEISKVARLFLLALRILRTLSAALNTLCGHVATYVDVIRELHGPS